MTRFNKVHVLDIHTYIGRLWLRDDASLGTELLNKIFTICSIRNFIGHIKLISQ